MHSATSENVEVTVKDPVDLSTAADGIFCHEVDSRLNVLIVYEDYVTGQRALNLCRRLAVRSTPEMRFEYNLWRFDVLELPGARAVSAEEAVKADLLLFSAWANTGPTPILETWMKSWLPKKQHETSALIALMNLPEGSQRGMFPLHVRLRQIALLSGMSFVLHVIKPEFHRKPITFSRITEPALMEHQLPGVRSLSLSPEHWGIND